MQFTTNSKKKLSNRKVDAVHYVEKKGTVPFSNWLSIDSRRRGNDGVGALRNELRATE